MDVIYEKERIIEGSILMQSKSVRELVNIVNNLVSEIDEVGLLNALHNASEVV